MDEMNLPEYCLKPTIILGCGSVLRGDDGFGSRVIEMLQQYPIPENVAVVDVGTGVGEILLDIAVSPVRPKRIILVDAYDTNAPTGMISVFPLAQDDSPKVRFSSIHQSPLTGSLHELDALGIEVTLVTVQPEPIPDEMQVDLSQPVREALCKACQIILGLAEF